MEKDTIKTEVIFRKWTGKTFNGTIFALFPYVINVGYEILSYSHIGQHSGADYDLCIKRSTSALFNEYKPLMLELESIGYNLLVMQKRSHSKYLEEYNRVK